jgi:outer membrane receptor protein involved in Fe transport
MDSCSWLSHKPLPLLTALMVATGMTWLPCQSVHAQIGTGTLTGTVTDASTKQPLADVVVTATATELQGEQTVVTDSTGTFRIPTLPPGEYSLRYEADTFRPFSRTKIPLRSSVTLRADAQLLPETLKAEEVTVLAKAPTVDVGSARSGVTIDSDFTSRLPVASPTGKGGASRSFEQLAEVAPGVHTDHFGASIAGTTSVENQYMIDGISVGDPGFGYNSSPLSIDFIKETTIITGGYLPEYGRGGGGVLDVTTKSGSNEFRGSVWGNLTPWQARPKFPPPQDAISTTWKTDNVRDMGFDLGGPLIKDKLWFYLGGNVAGHSYTLYRDLNSLNVGADGRYIYDADGLITSQRIPGTRRTYYATQTGGQYIGKLTWSPTQDDRIELSHTGTPTRSGGGGDYSIDYETGLPEIYGNPGTSAIIGPYKSQAWKQISDSYNTSLKWTHSALNKRLTFDTILGWSHSRTADLASDGTIGGPGLSGQRLFVYGRTNPQPHPITDFENIGDPTLCSNTIDMGDARCPTAKYAYGGPQILRDKVFNRYVARELVTFVTPGLGHHIIKAGAEFEYMDYSSKKGYPGGTLLQERAGGADVNDARRYGGMTAPDEPYTNNPLRIKTHTISFGAFLQDSWSIMDKVTLNAGFRYDTQALYGDYGIAMKLPNQWSPRLGLIFDPTQSGRAKIFANYAIYYQTFPLDIMDRAGSGEPQIRGRRRIAGCNPQTSANYPAGCDDPANLIDRFSPYGPNKYWNYQSTGITAVDPEIKSQSTNEISAGGEYEIIPNGRIGVTYIHRWLNNIIEDMSRDEGTTYFIGNPGSGIATDFPKATRTYDAGVVSFTKTFSDWWLAQASYTLSSLRGNWEGQFRSQTFQLDPGITSEFDLRSLLVNRSGPLAADRRHEIKIYLARELELAREHHINIGASYRSRSGGPTNYLGAHPTYLEGEAFILPRGSAERYPWVHTIDLHIGYTFFRSKNATFSFTWDIFNLLNFQAITRWDENYTIRPVLPITGTAAAQPFVEGNRRVIDPTRITPSDGEGRAFEASDRNRAFGAPQEYQEPITMRFGIKATY